MLVKIIFTRHTLTTFLKSPKEISLILFPLNPIHQRSTIQRSLPVSLPLSRIPLDRASACQGDASREIRTGFNVNSRDAGLRVLRQSHFTHRFTDSDSRRVSKSATRRARRSQSRLPLILQETTKKKHFFLSFFSFLLKNRSRCATTRSRAEQNIRKDTRSKKCSKRRKNVSSYVISSALLDSDTSDSHVS